MTFTLRVPNSKNPHLLTRPIGMQSKLIAIGVAVTVCAALRAPTVSAQGLNCSAYANAAVAQQQQNVQQGCGFTGGAWSNDFNGHFSWCQSATMADLTREDQTRKDLLTQCMIAKDQEQIQQGKPGMVVNPSGQVGLNPQPEPPSQPSMVVNPSGQVGLNPQPEPPSQPGMVVNPSGQVGLNPQPEPPSQPGMVVNPSGLKGLFPQPEPPP